MSTRILLRRDTAATWSTLNPVLADGEPAVERDTGKLKIGDGATPWSLLPYILDVSDLTPILEELIAAAVPPGVTDENVRDIVGDTVVGDGDFIVVTDEDSANVVRVQPGAALTELAEAVPGKQDAATLDTDAAALVGDPETVTGLALIEGFGRAAPVLSDFVYESATENLLSYKEDGIPIVLTYNVDGTVATSKRGEDPAQVYSYSGGNLVGVA